MKNPYKTIIKNLGLTYKTILGESSAKTIKGESIGYLTGIDMGVYMAQRTATKPGYISHVFNVAGKDYYQNKGGRCIDAPCCGCCNI